MENTRQQLIDNFLNSLNTEIDIAYHLSTFDWNDVLTFDDIREHLEECDAFNEEIIYNSNAIAYLQKNDPSLKESLEIASDLGYQTADLNSELLASLLASQNVREEFEELETEFENFFEELQEFDDQLLEDFEDLQD